MESASQSTEQASQTPPLGIVHELDGALYHSGPGLSHSDVKLLLRTPFHFYRKTSGEGVPPKMPSDQMRNGSAVHCAALEPDAFAKRYAVAPTTDKRTRAWREFSEGLGDRIALTPIEHDAVWRQAKALQTHRRVRDLLALAGDAEVSAYWRDPETNVLCKCRPDRWCDADAGIVLLDVKTTSDASPDAFSRSVQVFGYHTQADWYCTGWEQATARMVFGMIFACVEVEWPHAVAAYLLDDDALIRARARNRRALETFVRCTRSNDWPGYSPEVEAIGLPRWSKDE